MISSSMLVSSSILIVLFSPFIFSTRLQSLFEIQVRNELLASNTYLTFAHRLSTHGVYQGFAKFFFDSAEEEREHGKKLLDYYNLRNRELSLYDIKIDDEIASMTDLTKMIQTAARLEQQVYDSLIAARLEANNDKDYPTVHFIQTQMLEEQTEALKYMSDLVKRIERNSGDSTILLQMLDQDLRKKQVKQS